MDRKEDICTVFFAPRFQLLASIYLFFQKWREEASSHKEVFSQIFEHLRTMVSKYNDL